MYHTKIHISLQTCEHGECAAAGCIAIAGGGANKNDTPEGVSFFS